MERIAQIGDVHILEEPSDQILAGEHRRDPQIIFGTFKIID